MTTFFGLNEGETGTDSINVFLPTEGTPVNAVASQGTLTVDTQVTATNTMTIGTKLYTFVADGAESADGDISVGTDLATGQANIVAAINGTDSINTAHPDVAAGDFSTDDCIITAKVKGAAGDTIATTETFTAGTNVFDAATLGTTTAGVNGTPATRAGECKFDGTYIYYTVGTQTINDNNWRRIALGSAY